MTSIKEISKVGETITDDGETIGKQIGAIRTMSGMFHAAVAACATNCVLHCVVHGNTTPANQLIDAIGNMARRNALRDWFQSFGPFVWNKEDSKLVLNRLTIDEYKKTVDEDRDAFVKMLLDEPFFEWKREATYNGFDLDKELKKLLDRARKINDSKDLSSRSNTNLEHFDKFREFVASVN